MVTELRTQVNSVWFFVFPGIVDKNTGLGRKFLCVIWGLQKGFRHPLLRPIFRSRVQWQGCTKGGQKNSLCQNLPLGNLLFKARLSLLFAWGKTHTEPQNVPRD